MAGGGGSLSVADRGRTQRALELAYRYVSRRERTVSEVRQHLLRRDIDETSVDAAIAELLEHGYLDDARFAQLFVEDKHALEEWGGERIRRVLVTRGIDRETIDEALASAEEGDGELTRALSVLRQRFPVPPQGRRDRERALGVLLRKGYDADLALEALAQHRAQAV